VIQHEEIEQIHESTVELLADTGVRLEHDDIVELILKSGGKQGNGPQEVRIPREMVEECLTQTPTEVVLNDRRNQSAVLTARSSAIFWTNPGLQILERGKVREVTTRDLSRIAQLCDLLDNPHGVMGMAVADVPPRHRDFVGARIIAENCRRHVRALCFTPRGMEALGEMKGVLPGNWLSIGFTAHGPLRWTHLALDIFKKSAGYGIPVTVNGEPMAGVTGPVTLAGSIVVGNAEILSGIVVNQLLEPGRPVIYNLGLAHTFDMRYATAVTGGPENALFAAAGAALGRFYRLPSSSWVSTESLFDDSQASLEKMFGYQAHTSAGVNLIWGMGQLESEKTISLVQLVLDDEMINYSRRFQAGMDIRSETIRCDLIAEVGICGSFLDSEHTRLHFRTELWEPRILNRKARNGGNIPLEKAAELEVNRLLDLDTDPALKPEEQAELHRIEQHYRERI